MKNNKTMFSLKRILLVKAKDRLEKATHRENKRADKLSQKEKDKATKLNFFTEAKELIDSLDKSKQEVEDAELTSVPVLKDGDSR